MPTCCSLKFVVLWRALPISLNQRNSIPFLGADIEASRQFSEAILSTPSWFIRAVNEREKYEWQVVGSERVHEEIAINQISRRLKIKRDELMQKFEKNYDSCMNEARAFTSTVFACFESRLSNPAVQ